MHLKSANEAPFSSFASCKHEQYEARNAILIITFTRKKNMKQFSSFKGFFLKFEKSFGEVVFVNDLSFKCGIRVRF